MRKILFAIAPFRPSCRTPGTGSSLHPLLPLYRSPFTRDILEKTLACGCDSAVIGRCRQGNAKGKTMGRTSSELNRIAAGLSVRGVE